MATWQFDLSAVLPNGSSTLPAESRFRVEGLLVGLYSPSLETSGWTMFGPSDGNRVDLFFDSDSCEVSIRIDARTDDRAFVTTVCALAKRLGCSLHAQELGETIAPEVDAIHEALSRSAAWRYALDPKAFIKNLGRS